MEAAESETDKEMKMSLEKRCLAKKELGKQTTPEKKTLATENQTERQELAQEDAPMTGFLIQKNLKKKEAKTTAWAGINLGKQAGVENSAEAKKSALAGVEKPVQGKKEKSNLERKRTTQSEQRERKEAGLFLGKEKETMES